MSTSRNTLDRILDHLAQSRARDERTECVSSQRTIYGRKLVKRFLEKDLDLDDEGVTLGYREMRSKRSQTIQSKIPRLRVPASASSGRPRARRSDCARGPVNAHTGATSEGRGCRRQSLKDQDGRRTSGSAVRSRRPLLSVRQQPALVAPRHAFTGPRAQPLRRARGRSLVAEPVHHRHGIFGRELPRKFE